MRVGLAYDLKAAVPMSDSRAEDALEEYDSAETVEGIAAALASAGHMVVRLGGGCGFLTGVQKEEIDIVFNIAEGLGNYRSREAQVPSVLEMLNIPYTGSDPQCLAICLDKPLTKALVARSGVSTPRWSVINSATDVKQTDWTALSFPVFVKPVHEGSSMGIRSGSRIDGADQLEDAVVSLVETYHQPVMVEEFVYGDEVTVGVTGNSPARVLGIMRVIPRKADVNFVYSLEVKRDWERLVEYECPANLDPSTLKKIEESALKAFNVLGCRDLSRVDFRIARDGTPYFLEVNPLPGLNPKSGDVVIMAKKMGWSYQELISSILSAAWGRQHVSVAPLAGGTASEML